MSDQILSDSELVKIAREIKSAYNQASKRYKEAQKADVDSRLKGGEAARAMETAALGTFLVSLSREIRERGL